MKALVQRCILWLYNYSSVTLCFWSSFPLSDRGVQKMMCKAVLSILSWESVHTYLGSNSYSLRTYLRVALLDFLLSEQAYDGSGKLAVLFPREN